MIIYLTAAFSLFLLTITTLVIWYGALVVIACLAIVIAFSVAFVAWLVTSVSGIFSERAKEKHFG